MNQNIYKNIVKYHNLYMIDKNKLLYASICIMVYTDKCLSLVRSITNKNKNFTSVNNFDNCHLKQIFK